MEAAIGVTGHSEWGMGDGCAHPKSQETAPRTGCRLLVLNLCGDGLFAWQFFGPDDQACLAAS